MSYEAFISVAAHPALIVGERLPMRPHCLFVAVAISGATPCWSLGAGMNGRSESALQSGESPEEGPANEWKAQLAVLAGALAGVLHQCPQFPAGKVSRTARATRAGLWGWRRRPVMSQSIAWGYSGGQSEGQRPRTGDGLTLTSLGCINVIKNAFNAFLGCGLG
mmetsp:Transcript_23472/g.33604  ORF Transcript_23472/g.33604 Transcript_23472/m.33604 type:complete len:164 (-) Transcript_23472:225-716(-)